MKSCTNCKFQEFVNTDSACVCGICEDEDRWSPSLGANNPYPEGFGYEYHSVEMDVSDLTPIEYAAPMRSLEDIYIPF